MYFHLNVIIPVLPERFSKCSIFQDDFRISSFFGMATQYSLGFTPMFS